ncbi:MAG TPA: UPF0149 family protein [Xanthomonadaceae bacterium]|nr:UPF0149 family protein [Xanthomonadaceae bacterium]
MTQAHIDHAMLSQALTQARIPAGASDLHGSMCGFLCAGGTQKGGFMDSLALSARDVEGGGRDLLAALFGYCEHQLDDPQLGFQPLLPLDAQPLAERADALAAWCQGFLGGFGIAAGGAGLGDEVEEVLGDLAAIAASHFEPDPAIEEEENAYAELIEFVRVAVLCLRGELTAPVRTSGRPH